MITQLTTNQKLNALATKYYQFVKWMPKAGDYYTTSRNDLEIYKIVKIEDGKVFTEYCTNPGALSEWEETKFTTEGFGPCRVWVPDWILKHP